MQLEIRSNRDVWAGAMLIVTGATSVIIARDYAFGTSLRMGPGYFPSVLGGMLVLFGLYLVASGLRSNEKIEGNCQRASTFFTSCCTCGTCAARSASFFGSSSMTRGSP